MQAPLLGTWALTVFYGRATFGGEAIALKKAPAGIAAVEGLCLSLSRPGSPSLSRSDMYLVCGT